MRNFFILGCLLVCFCVGSGKAQSLPRYLVYFKDKANTPFTIQNPEAYLSARAIARRQRHGVAITPADFPVNPTYIQAIGQTGAKVLYTTRWLNGALVEASDAQLTAIRNLPFFKGIERNLPLAPATTAGIARLGAVNEKFGTQETVDHGRMRDQLAMLGVPELNDNGFQGQGIIIAVLDAGFSRANELVYLKPLFDSKRILDTYDFISRNTNVYDDHFHGLNCLSTIAANQPGVMVGAAPEASFVLYRTENEYSETPYEEATWILAAERADSLGADIISCSLGYNLFDDPAYDYTRAQMDGKTALVTRGARHVARTGMLLVNSAGNEGNNAWRYITAPADADSILAVGAVFSNRTYAPFSSVGPTADGRIKPDVAAQGAGTVIGNDLGTGGVSTGNGTSFSAPLIAGLAADLWQAHPNLTAQQLREVLVKSGHQAANPDSLLGYGVPVVQRAQEIILQDYSPLATEPTPLTTAVLYPNPAQDAVYIRFGSQVPSSTEVQIISNSGIALTRRIPVTRMDVGISVAAFTPGLYFVKISTPQSVRVLKFIKR
ncbi:S8 family serine peptidase [Salmonirosea aquatica]|uniref:S8 family serine peptidase n=1 Tax=Salmonirosea aquatica TaxID=2654236 RepID=A0A7C9FWZ9_9BACT|nr:S8 family serine peptidase [Cytophagaceae bacterium SJW1-29]